MVSLLLIFSLNRLIMVSLLFICSWIVWFCRLYCLFVVWIVWFCRLYCSFVVWIVWLWYLCCSFVVESLDSVVFTANLEARTIALFWCLCDSHIWLLRTLFQKMIKTFSEEELFVSAIIRLDTAIRPYNNCIKTIIFFINWKKMIISWLICINIIENNYKLTK